MQHDLDYDRAWDKVSRKFWHKQWRVLIAHTIVFVVVNLYLFLRPQSALTFTTGYPPLIFLRDFGLENVPWVTLNWGIILGLHLILLIGVGLGERIFRYGVERELLRDFARVNSINEKRKIRPSYAALSEEDEAFDINDEVQEVSSRQSPR